jgi:hypothetical protein
MKRLTLSTARWFRLCVMAGGVLPIMGVTLPGLAQDYPMPAWAVPHVSAAMCMGSKLHLVATGGLDVAYERAYVVLMNTNILAEVQAAYLRELAAGAKTNLVITPFGTNGHYWVDWNNERADVFDVGRRTDTNNFFEGGYIVTGTRYFGAFETVINIRVQRIETGQASFRGDVLIYPHNGLIRFLFSNVFSVESYFRNTMIDMSAEIKRVCTSLCQSNNAPAAASSPAARK